jgi:hypothetical protein
VSALCEKLGQIHGDLEGFTFPAHDPRLRADRCYAWVKKVHLWPNLVSHQPISAPAVPREVEKFTLHVVPDCRLAISCCKDYRWLRLNRQTHTHTHTHSNAHSHRVSWSVMFRIGDHIESHLKSTSWKDLCKLPGMSNIQDILKMFFAWNKWPVITQNLKQLLQ